MGVLVQVLRGGGVSESLYLLVVSLFCGSFGEGDTPTGGAGGAVIGARRGAASCFIGAAGCCFVLRRRGGSVAGGMKKPLSVSERRAVF